MIFNCAYCGKEGHRRSGEVNRANRTGMNLYCDRECAGRGRRSLVVKSVDQQKAEKAAYDREYRERNREARKAQKAAYYKRTRDPIKEAEIRKSRMHLHVEYCRRPEYRGKKKIYDRQYRAKKFYGDFAECFLLTMAIRDECLSRMTDYEIRLEKGTLNKSQQRKRHDLRAYCNTPENGPLGNLERGERGQNGRLTRGRDRVSGP